MNNRTFGKVAFIALLILLVGVILLVTSFVAFGNNVLTQGSGQVAEKTITFNKELTNLDLQFKDKKVEIKSTDHSEGKIVYQDKENDSLIVDQNPNSLALKSKNLFSIFSFDFQSILGFFGINTTENKVIVEIPKETQLNNCTISTSSGDIGVSNINSKVITINTASGNTQVTNSYGQSLSIKLASGNVDLRQNKFQEEILLESASGNNTLRHNDAKKTRIKSASGNIVLEQVNTDLLDCDLASGNIEGDTLTFNQMNLGLVSGDVRINNIQGNRQDFIIESDILSGNLTVDGLKQPSKIQDNQSQSAKKISINAVSSSVNINFNK